VVVGSFRHTGRRLSQGVLFNLYRPWVKLKVAKQTVLRRHHRDTLKTPQTHTYLVAEQNCAAHTHPR
jgi:hypothetical protein